MSLFLKKYEEWLMRNGVKSAHNYSTRLKRVILEWNQFSKEGFVPFEKTVIPLLFMSKDTDDYIKNVEFRLKKYNEDAFKRGEYVKGYRNDIITAINRFIEFVISQHENESEIKDFTNYGLEESLSNNVIDTQKERELFAQDRAFFREFDIEELLDAIINRTRTRESAFWPARKFSGVLPEKGRWIDPFVNSLIVMTECGIHKLMDVRSFKIENDILYVKPQIYVDNHQMEKSKARELAQISTDGYVKAYSYQADGSIQPFKVSYDKSGSPIPSISFEHTPAISLIISKGDYPEISNLIKDRMPEVKKLQKELSDVLRRLTCVLMQRDQNVRKKDAW